ncbi:MAG: amidohydrolase family protein [Lachnospiraceae bacterium]
MIIDGHSHVILPTEKHIELMDNAGVDKTILFYTSVHPETASTLSDLQKEMQLLNGIIGGKSNASADIRRIEMVRQKEAINLYPTRFIGFGSVPLTFITEKEACEYVEKEVVNNGYVGLGEFTLPSGAAKLLSPIFKASVNFGNLPLWIHAFHPLVLQDINEIADYAKDYHSVPVILGHLGGSNWLETIDLVKSIPNLYLDISAYFSTLVLKMAINELPAKCLWGVDLPYGDLQLSLDAVRSLANDEEISKAVLGDNIAGLLGI